MVVLATWPVVGSGPARGVIDCLVGCPHLEGPAPAFLLARSFGSAERCRVVLRPPPAHGQPEPRSDPRTGRVGRLEMGHDAVATPRVARLEWRDEWRLHFLDKAECARQKH